MKLTWSWLQDHLETSISVDECVIALTNLGFEVEEVIKPQFTNFVVGNIVKVNPHPNANRLHVCEVIDKDNTSYQVVCGALNVRENLKIILALPGALIPQTQALLKKGSIRGVESQGMICSKNELGLEDSSEGIWELQDHISLETKVETILDCDDIIIDISITPNRSDAFSVRGLARDLAAAGYGRLKPLVFEELVAKDLCPVNVVLQTPACTLLAGIALDGIQKAETPSWIAKRLEIAKIRLIHPAVDIANFVCLDIGRPLHVYDAHKMGDKLIVRQAFESEKLEGLDGENYVLEPSDVVTADPRAALAIAGVLGGKGSAVSEITTQIFIESAYFSPIYVRRTGQRLGILSESRTRFERGVDPEDVVLGLRYALFLLHSICGGDASQMVVIKTASTKPLATAIHFSAEAFRERTGVHLSFEQAVLYLQRLGCHFERQTPVSVRVIPPSWRHDITSTEDLIEEVLRLHGYDSLPITQLPPAYIKESHNFIVLKKLAAHLGLSEVYTWSLVSEEEAIPFGGGIYLNNSLSKEMAVLRPSLLIGLLNTADIYQRRSCFSAHIFEIAHQFQNDQERSVIAGLRMGPLHETHWRCKNTLPDFFQIKSDVEKILEYTGVTRVQWERDAPSFYHPGRSATIKQGKVIIGYCGELHPSLTKEIPIVGFELFLDVLLPFKKKKMRPYTVSPYQRVVRDFAFIVDRSFAADNIVKIVEKVPYVESVNLFDIYEELQDHKKSLAIQVTLQPQHNTFTEEELLRIHEQIIDSVRSQCGGELRQ